MSDAADRVGPVEDRRIGGLAVRMIGRADAPPVLMSAGLGGGGGYWTPQLAALAAGYRVILYDHRGTGASERTALPDGYGVAHMADDIRLVLDGVGIARAHVVGHAAGALAGMELARSAPERVATLTVVNGWAVADPHFVRCFELRRAIYEAGGAAAYLRAQPLFLYPAAWISDHLAQLDAEAAAHVDGFQDRATLFARMAALQAYRADPAAIRCPTLIVASADDMLVPARASRGLADHIAGAELATMPWGGHAVNVTAAPEFNARLVAFLDRHRI